MAKHDNPGSVNKKSARMARNGRTHYPYSVVSGGVTTAAELVEASQNDPVVKAHYTGIDAGRLKPTPLGEDRKAYVSYRVQNEVFWTSKPVNLRKGELVLTDGENFVRARCGNRISETPRLPVASIVWEPDDDTLNPPDGGDGLVPGTRLVGWDDETPASSQPLVMATLSNPQQQNATQSDIPASFAGMPYAATSGSGAYLPGGGGGGGGAGGSGGGTGSQGGGNETNSGSFQGGTFVASTQTVFIPQLPWMLHADSDLNRRTTFESWTQLLQNGGFSQYGGDNNNRTQQFSTSTVIADRLNTLFTQHYGWSFNGTNFQTQDRSSTIATNHYTANHNTTTTVVHESFEKVIERIYNCCTDCSPENATPEPGTAALTGLAMAFLAFGAFRLNRH